MQPSGPVSIAALTTRETGSSALSVELSAGLGIQLSPTLWKWASLNVYKGGDRIEFELEDARVEYSWTLPLTIAKFLFKPPPHAERRNSGSRLGSHAVYYKWNCGYLEVSTDQRGVSTGHRVRDYCDEVIRFNKLWDVPGGLRVTLTDTIGQEPIVYSIIYQSTATENLVEAMVRSLNLVKLEPPVLGLLASVTGGECCRWEHWLCLTR